MANSLDTNLNEIPDEFVANAVLYRLATALGYEPTIDASGEPVISIDIEDLVKEAEEAIWMYKDLADS